MASEEARRRMVREQLVRRGIRDARVLEAMGSVPRELFVPARLRHEAYEDAPLPIGSGQTISQPYMVARTCELAQLSGDERVLEIGGGSGYQAAVLGRLAREVVAIERLPELAERATTALGEAGAVNVRMVCADGTSFEPGGRFDVIVVAAAAPHVAQVWLEELAPGGRLIVPVGSRSLQILRVVHKAADGSLREVEHDACVFVPLLGADGFPEG